MADTSNTIIWGKKEEWERKRNNGDPSTRNSLYYSAAIKSKGRLKYDTNSQLVAVQMHCVVWRLVSKQLLCQKADHYLLKKWGKNEEDTLNQEGSLETYEMAISLLFWEKREFRNHSPLIYIYNFFSYWNWNYNSNILLKSSQKSAHMVLCAQIWLYTKNYSPVTTQKILIITSMFSSN